MTEEHKKLYRSETNRWLLGVCGGLGEYFNVDPTLVRILFIVFALVFGGGFLLYLILWIIMPMKPPEIETSEDTEAS